LKKIDFVTKPVSLLSSGYSYLYFDDPKNYQNCLDRENISIRYEEEDIILGLTKARKLSKRVKEVNKYNSFVKEYNLKNNLPISCQPPVSMMKLKRRKLAQ